MQTWGKKILSGQKVTIFCPSQYICLG